MVRMPGAPRGKKLFYGWVVVGGGFLSQMITGINFQGFSTYLPLLEDEFGWSKTLLSAPRSFGQVETALLGPINGYLVDRLGPRIMIISGVVIFGLGLVLFGLVHSVWSFLAVFALMAVGSSFSSLLVVSTAINNWFRRRRTLGIALATTGLGVSGVIAIPLIVLAQDAFGWRTATMASGVAVWVIGIPAGLMMRDRPENYGLLPDGDLPEDRPTLARRVSRRLSVAVDFVDFTVREAFHTPAFWLISFGLALGMFSMSAVVVHQFSHMERGVGLTRSSAAIVIMVMSAFNIGGRLFGGFLGDRLPKRVLLGVAMLGSGIATLILATATGLAQVMVFGVIYGSAWGVRTPISNAIRGEYFGRSHFGQISGFSQVISSPLGIAGPVLAGLLADIEGKYEMTFILFGALSLVASVPLFLAGPPRPPVRASLPRAAVRP
jgi:sugar phosphate permease